jgi:hypothetical protein
VELAESNTKQRPSFLHRSKIAEPFLVGVLVTIGAWRSVVRFPTDGLDSSWMTALNVLANAGRNWGSDVAFTFGPLGYLFVPMALSTKTLILQFLIQMTLFLWVFHSINRLLKVRVATELDDEARISYPLLSVLATLLFSTQPFNPELFFCAFVAHLAVQRWNARRADLSRLAVLFNSTICSVLLLSKFNLGVAAVIVCMVSVVGLLMEGRTRNLAALGQAATIPPTLFTLWIGSGQRAEDFTPYLRTSWDIASGFGRNMVSVPLAEHWLMPVGTVATLTIAGLTFFLIGSFTGVLRWAAITEGIVLLAVAYFAVRSLTIRQDSGHAAVLAASLAASSLALMPLLLARYLPRESVTFSNPAVLRSISPIVVLTVVAWSLQGATFTSAVNPSGGVRSFAVDVSYFIDSEFRSASQQSGADALKTAASPALGLIAQYVESAANATLDVQPYDTNYAWASGMQLSLPPAFQRYQAYTRSTDQQNQAHYLSSDAADFLLVRNDATIDGRSPVLESPRTMKSLFCRYELVDVLGGWSLHRRIDVPTCRVLAAPVAGKTCVVLHPAIRQRSSLGSWVRDQFLRPSSPRLRLDSKSLRATDASFDEEFIVGGLNTPVTIAGVSFPSVQTGNRFLCT